MIYWATGLDFAFRARDLARSAIVSVYLEVLSRLVRSVLVIPRLVHSSEQEWRWKQVPVEGQA